MKRLIWKRHHKWFGLLFCFFFLMFCLSGIILNHRSLVSDIPVSRNLLPDKYHFNKWNGGLLRGTLSYVSPDSVSGILLYGNAGIWKTDSLALGFSDFNEGLPDSPDLRMIRNLVQLPDSSLWAVSPFGLFTRNETSGWKNVQLNNGSEERFSDITTRKDTVVVVGRSYLYLAVPPYKTFQKIALQPALSDDGKVSLFRTIWMIHSGELFGIVGILLMDSIALFLIILCFTGVFYWLLPKYIRMRKRKRQSVHGSVTMMKHTFNFHNWIGRKTLLLTLFICLTGWALRPPVLLFIAKMRVRPVPFSTLESPNPWHDCLRSLRFDETCNDWILSASEGLYTLKTLHSVPVLIGNAPPVSVMGINVLQKDDEGCWLTGSFNGLYKWDRLSGESIDYFTGERVAQKLGSPFGEHAVSGYSADFRQGVCVVDYNEGTTLISQPAELATLPMSLWNLALEIHTGRIYTVLGSGTLLYITLSGLIALWVIWSGYKVRKR